jgi:diguanylate cyclase (GGDEF)-like protein
MNNRLTELTDRVINEILTKEVVLPSYYKEVFERIQKDMGIEIDEHEKILTTVIEKDFTRSNNIIDSTKQQLSKLEKSTTTAQQAILQKDEAMLCEVTNEITQMQKDMTRLQTQFYIDPLTRTHNRAWINEYYLNKEFFKTSGSLTFIDLNKFKELNEQYGHVVADKILIFLANFLKENFKKSKLVRYSGVEFLLLSTQTRDEMNLKLEQTASSLTGKKLKAPNGDTLQLSFSYGVVDFEEKEIFRDALETAGTLMYSQKK